MTLPLRVEPEAEVELVEAVEWYEGRSRGLGLEFARVVRAGLAAIERTPTLGSEVERGIRQVVLRRFPYSIYYILDETEIAVIAVFHGRRDPTEWRTRR